VNLQELNELDFSNVGDWPLAIKLVLVLLVCGLVGVGGYFWLITDQQDQFGQVQRQEAALKQEFESKQDRAANLENYKKQLAVMQESFGAMRRQLPDSTEVAELLVDVSQTGLAAGLEFELFQPQAETPREFYAELPIKIRVKGTYHEFGAFISGLASLPRIVTIHNVHIRPVGKGSDQLVLEATAKTYRYLDEGGR
jgi:type IV pilus assembly protein PilO